jgi:hypothetical protein
LRTLWFGPLSDHTVEPATIVNRISGNNAKRLKNETLLIGFLLKRLVIVDELGTCKRPLPGARLENGNCYEAAETLAAIIFCVNDYFPAGCVGRGGVEI